MHTTEPHPHCQGWVHINRREGKKREKKITQPQNATWLNSHVSNSYNKGQELLVWVLPNKFKQLERDRQTALPCLASHSTCMRAQPSDPFPQTPNAHGVHDRTRTIFLLPSTAPSCREPPCCSRCTTSTGPGIWTHLDRPDRTHCISRHHADLSDCPWGNVRVAV